MLLKHFPCLQFPKKHIYDFKLTEFTCTILKCLKTYIRQIYFLKHDIITLKIRFIEPLHDKTSDLDFASNEDRPMIRGSFIYIIGRLIDRSSADYRPICHRPMIRGSFKYKIGRLIRCTTKHRKTKERSDI